MKKIIIIIAFMIIISLFPLDCDREIDINNGDIYYLYLQDTTKSF